MNFKKWDEIIKDNKYEMLFFEIYYNFTCYDDKKLKHLTEEEKKELMYLVHDSYLKDESRLDLGYMCDTAMKYAYDILTEKWDKWTFLDKCYYENI